MQIHYFYRYEADKRLTRCGHFTKDEMLQLYLEGYKESKPRRTTAASDSNKNGIPVQQGKRRKGS